LDRKQWNNILKLFFFKVFNVLINFFQICAVCHEAAMCALQENIDSTSVTSKHINDALSMVTPRIDSKLIKFYHDYHLQSGLNAI
jgi:AAA family ATPase